MRKLVLLSIAFWACQPKSGSAPADAAGAGASTPSASHASPSRPPPAPSSPSPKPTATHAPLAPLPAAIVARATKSVESLEENGQRAVRARAAAELLGEIEKGRLPKALVNALSASGAESMDAAQRRRINYEAVYDTPELLAAWNHACDAGKFADGALVLANLGGESVADRQKVISLYRDCRLSARGLVSTPSELGEDPDLLLLAHTTLAYLDQRGGSVDVEKRALTLVAKGMKAPSKPITAEEVKPLPDPKTVSAKTLKALRARMKDGIALLEAGKTRQFLDQLMDPRQVARWKKSPGLEKVSKELTESGRGKELLEALRWASTREAISESNGAEARFVLPMRPGPHLRALKFREREGAWYLSP